MKVRELIYWVVILLQLILLVGIKEQPTLCSHCEEPVSFEEMVFLDAYGTMHKKCAKLIPPFQDN